MKQAIDFYTHTLDFDLKYHQASANDPVIDLINGEIELQLTISEGDYLFGSVAYVLVEDIDERFKKYLERGLDISNKDESPVHQGPLDQSWGTREFYVTDADRNTLRFCQVHEAPKAIYKNVWPYLQDAMNLPVKDLDAAIPFYTTMMNFQQTSKKEDPKSATLQRDSIQIGLAENGGDPSQEGCFFEVDSVDNALKELQFNGLQKEASVIDEEIHNGITWRVFYVVAPDGLCYCLGERQKD